MVPTEEGIRLGTILASILAGFALFIAAETAQRHEMSQHEEELAGDLFFSGVVSLVAAGTGIVYFVALVLTAISSVCFIAPTARHRLRFRERDLEWVVDSANRLMVVGLICLGGAIAAVLLLVTMVVFSDAFAVIVCVLIAALIVWTWFGAPLVRGLGRNR